MKISFKNFMALLITMSFVLLVAACGGGDKDAKTTAPTGTTGDGATNGNTTQPSGFDFGGMDIVFLVNTPSEVDPNLDNYSGTNRGEKLAAQKAVEQKYNVKIVYQTYPDGAGWGPPRQQAIINGVTSGNPIGHFYMITSQWVPNLAGAEAIAPVGRYIRDHANTLYDPTQSQFGTYKGEVFTFDSGLVIHDADGLYYNLTLWDELALGDTPAALWNKGEWTWDKFEEVAQKAAAQMDDNQYPIGGIPAVYAQHMIPGNGGYLVNPTTNRVAFNTTNAINTINFLRDKLYLPEYWEPAPEFDAGSALWKSGGVLFHPGDLWFLNTDMRWLGLPFEVSYVPYPKGNNTSNDDYRIGKAGQTQWAISGGYEKENNPDITDEELFLIWNDLQVWKPHEEQREALEARLINAYDDLESVDAHLSVARKVYSEQIFTVPHGHFGDTGYYVVTNRSVYDGDAKSKLDQIAPIYQALLDDIHN